MTDSRTLVVEYQNRSPVEILELSASLAALGDQFKRFVAEHGGIEADARLFVHEMRRGSIVAELISLSQAVNDLYENRELIGGFLANWREILEAILRLSPRAKELDKQTLRNARSFVAPTAHDGGAQINITATDGGTAIAVFNLPQQNAGAIAHNATHLLNAEFPQEEVFSNEPMSLFQLRDAPPGKTGDQGQIDRYADAPKKLTFADEATKQAIIHHPDNPFDHIFWVNGKVKTVGGRVVGYHITGLVEATSKNG